MDTLKLPNIKSNMVQMTQQTMTVHIRVWVQPQETKGGDRSGERICAQKPHSQPCDH